jgi:hypothetical protein
MIRLSTQFQLAASKAICQPDVRRMIRIVEHLCNVRQCSTEDLRALTREVEPNERFMWIMRDVPHVVVYLDQSGSVEQPVIEEREQRLRRLLEPPWLDFAQVWVVGHSAVKDDNRDFAAMERASKVAQIISNLRFTKKQLRFPASHILKFSYDFPLVLAPSKIPGIEKNGYINMLDMLYKNILIKNDQPLANEPQDPRRGVWVYLIDCVA